MSKLIKYISEYFLGTETRKFYSDEKKFYREFITDEKDLTKFLRNSKICEGSDLVFGKIIPNLIDIATITHSLITKSPPYGLLAGEGIRLYVLAKAGPDKRLNKSLRGLIRTVSGLNKTMTNIENKSQNKRKEV